MNHIPFSLVTTCLNEMRSFERWKANILEQTRAPDEIVVVDAFSNDGTHENLLDWAASDSRVRVIQAKGAVARGRNLAIEHATHEHILSTDMGVRLNEVWCEELIKPFEADAAIQVVVGNTCIDIETLHSAAARAEFYIEPPDAATPGPGAVAGNRSVAYTKEVWRSLGGLPEDLTLCADDSVFGRQMLQAGLKFAYAPEAMTYWGRPRQLKQFWKEQFNYGRGDGEAFIKCPAAVRWHLDGRVPGVLVAPLTALRMLQRRMTMRAVGCCLAKFDLTALAVMPLLVLGQGWNLAKGYLVGYRNGTTQCVAARARLGPGFRS